MKSYQEVDGRGKESGGGGGEIGSGGGGGGNQRTRDRSGGDIYVDGYQDSDYRSRGGDGYSKDRTNKLVEVGVPGTGDIRGGANGGGSHLLGGGTDT